MAAHYAVAVAWDDGEGALPAGQEGLAVIARSIRDTRVVPLPEPRPADARILLSRRSTRRAGRSGCTRAPALPARRRHCREHQVLAIDEAIRALGRERDSPPQILCGDFNATSDSDEIRFLRGLTTLGGRRTHFQDALAAAPTRARARRRPGPGHHVVEREPLHAPAALSRSRSPDRLRVRHHAQEGRPRHGSRLPRGADRARGPSARSRSARATTTACAPTFRSWRRRRCGSSIAPMIAAH